MEYLSLKRRINKNLDPRYANQSITCNGCKLPLSPGYFSYTNDICDNCIVFNNGNDINGNQLGEKKIVERNGYVYFIYSKRLYDIGYHYIKIGKTKNLEQRLMSLQCGCPFKLEIYKTIKSSEYDSIESNLHKKYSDKNVLNEWFELNLDEIDRIVQSYPSQN